MHLIPLHIGDFSQATARFRALHVGLFVRLLMEYYKTEAPLPGDVDELAFLAGADTPEERQALNDVLKRCFVHDPANSLYVQRRTEREIKEYERKGLQTRYANVMKYWNAVNEGITKPTFEEFIANQNRYYDEATKRVRKVDHRTPLVLLSSSEDDPTLPLPDTSRTPATIQPDSDTSPTGELQESVPVTSNQKPGTKGSPIVPKGDDCGPSDEAVAEAIYALYPRKVGHGKAIPAIIKALKKHHLTELEMQAKVKQFAQAMAKWSEQDSTYIPHPATWFNQERYLDDPATWVRTDSTRSKPGFDAQKKEGGAGPGLFEAAPNGMPAAPDGWETAMEALWGADWPAIYPSWERVLPVDQRQVREWLEKNKGGAAGGLA